MLRKFSQPSKKLLILIAICSITAFFALAFSNEANAQCSPEGPCGTPEPTETPTVTPTPTVTFTSTPTPSPTPTSTPTPPVTLCKAGGPYLDQLCSSSTLKLALTGTVDAPASQNGFTIKWSSTCPSAVFTDATVLNPNMTFTSQNQDGTPISCQVKISVFDTRNDLLCSSDSPVTVAKCTKDCAGTINGQSKFDACGVCDGNGTSCITCNQVDIKAAQFQLDGRSLLQANLVKRIANRILLNPQSTSAQKKVARAAVISANALYLKNWQMVWGLPSQIANCTGAVSCSAIDLSSGYAAYLMNSKDLFDLLTSTVKTLREVKGDPLAATGQLKRGRILNSENLTEITKLPNVRTVC